MRIKSQRDFWSGVMFILAGIGFAWGATNYSFGNSARPGPAYFPFGLGILMAILGAMVTFKALTVETEGGDPIGDIGWKPLIIIVPTPVACAPPCKASDTVTVAVLPEKETVSLLAPPSSR